MISAVRIWGQIKQSFLVDGFLFTISFLREKISFVVRRNYFAVTPKSCARRGKRVN